MELSHMIPIIIPTIVPITLPIKNVIPMYPYVIPICIPTSVLRFSLCDPHRLPIPCRFPHPRFVQGTSLRNCTEASSRETWSRADPTRNRTDFSWGKLGSDLTIYISYITYISIYWNGGMRHIFGDLFFGKILGIGTWNRCVCVLLCLPHKPQFMGIPHLILLVLFGSTQF